MPQITIANRWHTYEIDLKIKYVFTKHREIPIAFSYKCDVDSVFQVLQLKCDVDFFLQVLQSGVLWPVS